MEIYSVTPMVSPIRLDIMFGDKWGGQISFPCTPGREYSYEELKAFARTQRPSLERKAFDVIPCGRPRFRN